MTISLDEGRQVFVDARREIGKAFVGYEDLITCIFLCLISGSVKSPAHMLCIGKPGTGKTLISGLLAHIFGLEFKRIDGTGEPQPSDIIGYFDPRTNEIIRGPIFTNILLVDEINRLSRGARASLLAPMAEGVATIGNTTYTLAPPFFVIANENPASYGDAIPLRTQERDRFLLSFFSGWPSLEEQEKIIDINTRLQKLQHEMSRVCSREQFLEIPELVAEKIFVERSLRKYAAQITRQLAPEFSNIEEVSGDEREIRDTSIVRGSIALIEAARSYAFLEGKDYVVPAYIDWLSHFALPHRINAYSQEFGRVQRHALIAKAVAEVKKRIQTRDHLE
ncbi:MAG: AAA family ATPase [Candidatus Spechtbacteria bacterium]|nr:AAA family ATPase [Candidatus Spechtbacteria bacterium]